MECRNCSFQNAPGTGSCLRCQSLLDLSGVDVEPPRSSRNPFVRGTVRAVDLAAIHTSSIAGSFRPSLHIPASLRVPVVEILVAIIPGFPHVRSRAMGRRGFGWAIAVLWILAIAGSIAVIGDPLSDFLLYLAVAIHSTSFAMLYSDGLTRSSMATRVAVGLACFIMAACVLYAPVVYGAGQFIRPVQLSNVRATSWMADGDVLMCSGPRLNTDSWRRGDIVLVRMDSWAGGNGYVLDSRYNVDRLLGLPGDLVTIERGEIRVNGELVPAEARPLGSMLPDLSCEVPPDRYFVATSALRWTVHGIDVPRAIVPMYIDASLIRPEGLIGHVLWRVRPWSRMGSLEGVSP